MDLSVVFFIFLLTLFEPAYTQSAGALSNQPTTIAPYKNIWKPLSEVETASVTNLLQQRLNLTGNFGSSHDNYVYQVTLLYPNKTNSAIETQDGTGKDVRYARATVAFGNGPHLQEYMVGPLPVTNNTNIQLLQYPFTNKDRGKTNIHPVYSSSDGAQFLASFGSSIEDITKALWNTTLAEGVVGVRLGVPFWDEDGKIISWATFLGIPKSEVSSTTLLPRGVAARFDLTGRDWQDWKTTGWTCGSQFFNSTDAFRAAINAPGFKKPHPNEDGPWTSTDKRGDPLPLDDLPPPVSTSKGSQRFKLDADQDYVTWMDFSFYWSVAQDVGLSLHDIQYKGKRIIYELSLQEAMTHYAGSDPFQSQAVFFDTTAGMGANLVPLVKGYDCPSYATYLNSTFSNGNATDTRENIACIFEIDSGFPIRRHTSLPSYASVAKNIMFVIRTIATVGNYDFLIEYSFFYDGAIEVSCRASGYISSAYWSNNPDYGFHIHDYLNGGFHDHVLTWKADLDILGTKNSVQKVEFMPESITYPWSQGRVHNTMRASRGFVSRESSINWAGDDDILYAVVNKDLPNRLGEFPGYRFKRVAGTIHLTIKNSTDTRRASALSTHDFHITQQKDTEPRGADSYGQYATEDPLVDFSKFLDNESTEQEDVVVWFNLGMHHMPHTGDLPVTMFTATRSAMRFEPLNYLDGDPSVASAQQIRIQYDGGN